MPAFCYLLHAPRLRGIMGSYRDPTYRYPAIRCWLISKAKSSKVFEIDRVDYLTLSSGHSENTKKPCIPHDRGGGLRLGLGSGGLFLGWSSHHYFEPAGRGDRCDAHTDGRAACPLADRWRPDPSTVVAGNRGWSSGNNASNSRRRRSSQPDNRDDELVRKVDLAARVLSRFAARVASVVRFRTPTRRVACA